MKIKISSSLNSDAANINNSIKNFSNDINSLVNFISGVSLFWSGSDADSFCKKYNEAITKLKEYEKAFKEYQNYVSKVQPIFGTLDESYNKNISTE